MTADRRRILPIRLLAGLMAAYKRSADQVMRVPGQGTPGYPDWPDAPTRPSEPASGTGKRRRGRSYEKER